MKCGDEEGIGGAIFPGIYPVAMPAGTFVAKAMCDHISSLSEQFDLVGIGYFRMVDGFVAGIPYGEDDPAFGGTIDLDAKIATRETVGHEIAVGGIGTGGNGHFAIEGSHFGGIGNGVAQVHGGSVATRFCIEVHARCGGAGKVD